jgi:hypothetical protein
MKRGRMQCKDIPDELVIQAVVNTTEKGPGSWRRWDDVWPQFERLLPGVPGPLFYAKVDRMQLRAQPRIHACVHTPYRKGQCRGDVHLAEECKGC